MLEINQFISKLKEFEALSDKDEIKHDTVGNIEPHYADAWPNQLHSSILEAVKSGGIEQLYKHQTDAINKSLQGADVVMESPTASGKTLAFTLPMLDALKRTRGSHALMIYPMKALAFDQREQICELCTKLSIESWSYDGDTDNEHKGVIRKNPPQILFTNPEYLNMSFLGWLEQWEKFLRNLRYVVIDEMHEYRGFFGGNVALLLRRFFLHLNRLGAKPQVFLSTATCANPQEHARELTGRSVELLSARESLRPERHFIFVEPKIRDFRYREILRKRIEQAALAVLVSELQVLIFCPTKKFLEDAFRRCKFSAEEMGLNPEKISAFHADLKTDTRQKIQRKIISGEISVVFTTNALELGLDIGGLDGVILAGFPPSIMSAWQQIGRAGRSWNKPAFVLLYAMNDPIDRFFVGNLNAFLNKPFDELVIDPANENLIENHIPSLVAETGGKLNSSEKPILGDAFFEAAKKDGGTPVKNYRPQSHLNIRAGIGQSFKLKRGNEELGQISATRRFREAYIGAIFTFFGQRYHVHAHEENAVVLTEAEPNMRTDASFFTLLNPSNIFEGDGYEDVVETIYGSLNITMNFTGYKTIDERTGDTRSSGGTASGHYMKNHHAFWINPKLDAADGGIGAIEHMIRVGAMFVIPADRFDTSTYSRTTDGATAFYYENYAGGIGVAKKLFKVWKQTLEKGVEIALNCQCASGCQNCIDPAKSYDISREIDKKAGIELATKLLDATQRSPDKKLYNGRWIPAQNHD